MPKPKCGRAGTGGPDDGTFKNLKTGGTDRLWNCCMGLPSLIYKSDMGIGIRYCRSLVTWLPICPENSCLCLQVRWLQDISPEICQYLPAGAWVWPHFGGISAHSWGGGAAELLLTARWLLQRSCRHSFSCWRRGCRLAIYVEWSTVLTWRVCFVWRERRP